MIRRIVEFTAALAVLIGLWIGILVGAAALLEVIF